MGKSCIEYNNHGFWSYDSVFVIVYDILYNAIKDERIFPESWKKRVFNAGTGISGSMDLHLDTEITTDEMKEKLVFIIDSIIESINKDIGNEFSAEFLNNYTKKYQDIEDRYLFHFSEPVPSKVYIDWFMLFKKLLKNELNIKVSDKIDYWCGEINWE